MDAKKLLLVLTVVFMGFWLFTDPHGLARAASSGAEGGWGLLTQLFTSLINFFTAL